MRRERVHHRHAHAVQTAGELVVLVAELTACVQAREDELDAAHLLLRVDVHGHAAAVVHHFEGVVFEQRDGDFLGVSRQRFVDAVVDDLVRQMVRARGVRIHPRPAPHGLQAAQDFDVGRGVRRAHCSDLFEKKTQAEGPRCQTRAGNITDEVISASATTALLRRPLSRPAIEGLSKSSAQITLERSLHGRRHRVDFMAIVLMVHAHGERRPTLARRHHLRLQLEAQKMH